MNGSVAGACFLLVIGVVFLGAALFGWWHRHDADSGSGVLSITVDVLVGIVALVDAAISVNDEPARILLWSIGSFTLAVAVALLILHHRRPSVSRHQPY